MQKTVETENIKSQKTTQTVGLFVLVITNKMFLQKIDDRLNKLQFI